MVAVKDKTRYSHNDRNLYLQVLMAQDARTCVVDGMTLDPVLYQMACDEATKAVPLNDAPKGALQRHVYVTQRLQEAIDYRNRWYRDHLPAQGNA